MANIKSDDTVKRLRPLFTCTLSSDKEVHDWLKLARDSVLECNATRLRGISANLDLYSGAHFDDIDDASNRRRPYDSSSEDGRPETADIVINHLYDLTENRVSRLTRFKSNVTVLPANSDDVSDKQSAPMVKDLIDYWQYCNDFETLQQKRIRMTDITGEAYIFVGWDDNKGPKFPTKSSKKKSSLRIGDVSFRLCDTSNIFLQPVPSKKWDDVEWVLERERVDIDKLKFKYPKKKKKIEDESSSSYGTKFVDEEDDPLDDGEESYSVDSNHTWKWTLYHKSTPELPGGFYAVFVDGCVLESSELREIYKHGRLPYIRTTGIDVPGQLYAKSVYTHAKQLNHALDVMFTMAYRHIILGAHPKWVSSRGANVEEKDLGNDFTILEYDGEIPPELRTYSTVSPEIFSFAQEMKEVMQQFMGVFGVSRGEPPPGVKAGIAMQFLQEQENERLNQDVTKHNTAIRELWLLALDVARQYYDKNDDRLIQIFGEEREYMVKKFDPTKLSTKFDIRVQNSSNLPSSKTGRMQYILDLEERKPGIVPDEVFIDTLDLGVPESYVSYITKPFKAANIENEDMSNGIDIEEPGKWEDHLSHWKQHFSFIQGADFKQLSQDIRTIFLSHIEVHEMYLLQAAFFNENITMVKNPALAETLASLPSFPCCYEVPEPPPPPPPEASPNELADIEAAKASRGESSGTPHPMPTMLEDRPLEGDPLVDPSPLPTPTL